MLGFGLDKVKGLGDGNLLETIDVFRFWAPKKLKLNWLAKRVGSDSFTIRGKGYNRHMNGFPRITSSDIFLTRTKVVLKHALS